MVAQNDRWNFPEPPAIPDETEHLLKVAESVARDANTTWAEIWGQFKPNVTPGGMILPRMQKGFVPACGWEEFLEKFWLLKHYLDSISRVCRKKQ